MMTAALFFGSYQALAASANGPLSVLSTNPRYFTDGSGKAIYLTGSHTWANQQDQGVQNPPPVFDFNAYLDFLRAHNHNFIRLRRRELTRYAFDGFFNGQLIYVGGPQPWLRAGPGMALDGQPRFDLSRFDQAYFDRLRSRIIAARDSGIYVSVMFFDGHGIEGALKPWRWDGHPFNVRNNIDNIDGDPNGNGTGIELNMWELPAGVWELQKAYLRKVVDEVNDLDNVLYEVTNEAGTYSTMWQYQVINFVKCYEAEKPKQHPIGMTFQFKGGSNRDLLNSQADWISPNLAGGYRDNPPAADGSRVIITDTDHLWGEGGDRTWVWKSFARGLNTLYMDRIVAIDKGTPLADIAGAEDTRKNMGYTRLYADKMNLAAMTPQPSLSSTAYCLANPGSEYLVYQPASNASFKVGLLANTYDYEWFNPASGLVASKGSFVARTGSRNCTAPFSGDAVLYIVDSALSKRITNASTSRCSTGGRKGPSTTGVVHAIKATCGS